MGEGAGILLLEELGARPGPGRQDLRGGGGLRRHLRRLSHHRPAPDGERRRGRPWQHGAGGRRHRPGGRRTTSTPTAPPPPSTTTCETAADQDGLRRAGLAAGHQLDQVDDRPHAGRGRRGGGDLLRPGPAGRLPPRHHQLPASRMRSATWTSSRTRGTRPRWSTLSPTRWALAAITPP